jgi:hypothetical protein
MFEGGFEPRRPTNEEGYLFFRYIVSFCAMLHFCMSPTICELSGFGFSLRWLKGDCMPFVDAVGQHLFPHSPIRCLGQACTIHRPSNHHMVEWPQVYRHDVQVMQRRCVHGVDHPDPDDLKVVMDNALAEHGCDGCCQPVDL